MVSGCVLQPVESGEQVEWYGLSSEHTLPLAVFADGELRMMPYRTSRCDVYLGVELKAGNKEWEVQNRRSTVHASDASVPYESWGG